jgi:prevent-host-death family protein
MDYKTVTIKEARDNFSEIIEKVAIGGESFVVTKFGKLKAKISPLKQIEDQPYQASDEEYMQILEDTKGMWQDRKDIKDTNEWLNKLREEQSSRYGKIFT